MEALRKKLYFQSHHMGMKENDLIFGRFAEKYLYTLSLQDLLDYQKILSYSDLVLFNWLQGIEPLPNTINQILFKQIKSCSLITN